MVQIYRQQISYSHLYPVHTCSKPSKFDSCSLLAIFYYNFSAS
ncbi:unnamed protein product [Coffea canephora]|uniref:Uncharacterized protein n=1 Tax=Coffea canephora TaxID=49390 RepID=A0A068UIC1_COFCA|nr:unnamed protein product [Coffea canephora]